MRWLLDRGRVTRQPNETLHGRGIWFDVTEIHEPAAGCDGGGEDQPLEIAMDHCLRARERLRHSDNTTLRLLLGTVLLELDRDIAGRVAEIGSSGIS